MKKQFKFLLFFLLGICLCSGCVTLKETTLPAAHEASYDFPAYSLKPLDDPQWRLFGQDKDLQSLTFIHTEHYSRIFFWVTPALRKTALTEETEKDVIEYFQNKLLKDFKLSPDIELTEQSIKRTDKVIDGCSYKVLTLEYDLKEGKGKNIFSFYYYFAPDKEILYNFAVWKTIDKKFKPEWHETLENSFYAFLKNTTFKKPTERAMITLRVNYAFVDFLEMAPDKYLKEKSAEIKEKYDIALREANNWLKLKENNYEAYNFLGVLYCFNEKFEKYGEGFALPRALENFNKSIQIRPYFKLVHTNLAELYQTTGKIDDAIKEYELAIQISPNDEDLYYKLGQIYEGKGDKAKAKSYYETAIRNWGSGFQTLEELKSKIKGW